MLGSVQLFRLYMIIYSVIICFLECYLTLYLQQTFIIWIDQNIMRQWEEIITTGSIIIIMMVIKHSKLHSYNVKLVLKPLKASSETEPWNSLLTFASLVDIGSWGAVLKVVLTFLKDLLVLNYWLLRSSQWKF